MKKQILLMATILTLALALQACGGAAVTDSAGGAGGGAIPGGATSLDLSNPDNFKELPGNYQITMDFRFEGTQDDGTPIVSTWRLDGVSQEEPQASKYTFQGTGAATIEGSGIFEVTLIGDQSYFFTSAMGCISMGSSSETPFDSMVDTGGMLANEVQRVAPDETINGIPVYHYAITQDNLDLSDPTAMDVREITNGAIYVAKDGGYVVRMLLEGRGVSSLLSGDESLEGDIFYQLDFTPVPSVGDITPPEGCAGVSEADYPILPDASNVATFAGFLSYNTAADLQATIDFYKLEMPAAGWTFLDETTITGYATLRFSLGDRTASIVIVYDASSGTGNVIIGEEQ